MENKLGSNVNLHVNSLIPICVRALKYHIGESSVSHNSEDLVSLHQLWVVGRILNYSGKNLLPMYSRQFVKRPCAQNVAIKSALRMDSTCEMELAHGAFNKMSSGVQLQRRCMK